jgi:Transposase DDE domain
MRLSRIPQRVSNALAPLGASFTCPQGHHFRVFCWLLVTLIVSEGGAKLKALTRLMPDSLAYWTVLRMMRSGYWEAAFLVDAMSEAVLAALPPPADGVLHLTGDSTVTERTGEKQPLARKTRTNEYAPYVFGQVLVLMIAQWGRYRVPVRAAVVHPQIKGHQNLLFRQMLKDFVPPVWVKAVVVEADAAFAAKATLKLITEQGWGYVFGLARTWKLAAGTHLRDVARHTPHACYQRYVAHKPDGRRKCYWVFRRTALVRHLGYVTILFSKRRQNDGPKRIKLIVTNLTEETTTGTILSHYHRRWGVEVAFKELKSGLHLGQLQVTKEPERVARGLLLPVLAYLLLLRLYGRAVSPKHGASIWQLKRRFTEEVYQEQYDQSEHRWRKKLEQYRAAA